ncbi:nucleoside triphosphate pyrophosphohydrolase [Candidatus Marinamargulisbacteria bacterium SCGC AG-414-C22]|nr:nucleoside triphosphate pyrophosphohydrolase [Candidatus Marinamargulisbacteria bacterium SCGC AG-414-C22]
MPNIDNLIDVVKKLRSKNGCPWDKEQTFNSLVPCVIEEAYELVDALESNQADHICEELGDVLLHIVMLSRIAEEDGLFTFDHVAKIVTEKMIRRHPHVFGDKTAATVDDVWSNWESIKKQEKKSESIMDDIPKLPALLESFKIQKKAARVGFDWPKIDGPLEKLSEELTEFKQAFHNNDKENLEEEAGDLLFTMVNIFRKCGINPEDALRKSNKKFISRFKTMENLSSFSDFSQLPLNDLEHLWEQAKK